MLQQIPVIDCAEAEILEFAVTLRIKHIIQLAVILRDKLLQTVVDQPQSMSCCDGLRKRMDFLIANLFVDIGREQAGGQLRILWFFHNEGGSRLNGKPIEFARRRSVVETANRPGHDSEWIDVGETCATTIDGPYDLDYIDGLRGAVALSDPHGLRIGVVGQGLGEVGRFRMWPWDW